MLKHRLRIYDVLFELRHKNNTNAIIMEFRGRNPNEKVDLKTAVADVRSPPDRKIQYGSDRRRYPAYLQVCVYTFCGDSFDRN